MLGSCMPCTRLALVLLPLRSSPRQGRSPRVGRRWTQPRIGHRRLALALSGDSLHTGRCCIAAYGMPFGPGSIRVWGSSRTLRKLHRVFLNRRQMVRREVIPRTCMRTVSFEGLAIPPSFDLSPSVFAHSHITIAPFVHSSTCLSHAP